VSRDTPPHLSSSGRGDDTDPSTLADLTDPDAPVFDAIDVAEPSDEVAAFERRRRIYAQSSTSSSSDGSVAAAYHAVHEVPRAHAEGRPGEAPTGAVVVRPVTDPGPVAPPPAPSARDVSTFPLPRRSPRSPRLLVVAASALAAVGVAAWGLVRFGVTEPSPDAGAEVPAVASVTSRLLPPAAAVTALSSLGASTAASVSASPSAGAPLPPGTATTASPANRAQPARSSAPLPTRPAGQPPIARPGSSSSTTTPASARPAGDFDDLVREGKP
jgi:hypothetical protein